MRMTSNRKRIASTSAAVATVAALVGGAFAFATATSATPAPAPTREMISVVEQLPETNIQDLAPDVPVATPTPEPVAVEPAPAPAPAPVEEIAPAPAPVPQAPAPAPAVEPAPAPPAPAPAPIRCPGGSSATASDGVNDTGCLADVCFSIAVPDPAHPECNAPFRP